MSSYQYVCFGSSLQKPSYCLISRELITTLPLVLLWLSIPFYLKILRKYSSSKIEPDKWLNIHLILHAILILNDAISAIIDVLHDKQLISILRLFRAVSYILSCIVLYLLSTRLKIVHVTFIISFFLLATFKFIHVIVLIFESNFNISDIVELLLLVAQSVSFALSDKRGEMKYCEDNASILSRLFFYWINDLISTGSRRPLEDGDLLQIEERAKIENLYNSYKTEFNESKKPKNREDKSIVWPFISIQRKLICKITFARFVADILHYLNPILLKQFIDYVSMEVRPMSFGIAIACLMLVSATSRSLLQNFQVAGMFKLAVYFQSVLSAAIHSKTLRLSPSARSRRTVGEILNFAAVDIEIIVGAIPYMQNIWSVPFQITLAMIMLSITLGWPAIAGVIIMLLFIPLNYMTSRMIKNYQSSKMKLKDDRTKLSNEILNGMRTLKLFGWEDLFKRLTNNQRKNEVRMLRNVCILSRVVDIANSASPFLVAIASFSCFILFTDNQLTPSIAFVSLAIFNQLRQPMRMVANLINTFVQAKVSNKRLRSFLNEPEQIGKHEVALGNAVVFDNASLAWKHDAVLSDIDLTIRYNQLIAVVGSVGSGKSSLFSSILDEMVVLDGHVKVGGSTSYMPQSAWIFNATIRENILFGSAIDDSFYNEVIKACQLEEDIRQMNNGDLTIVGENGITLSGGQKARVALARAVYQYKDIYLLDDPLSAVDCRVASRLYNDVIGRDGLLKNKTRIMITHNLQFTKDVDVIYVMDKGRIVEKGSFEDLYEMEGIFHGLWVEMQSKQETYKSMMDDAEDSTGLAKKVEQKVARDSGSSKNPTKAISEKENVLKGRVKTNIYLSYFKTMGMCNSMGFVILLFLHFTIMALRSLWLSDWSNENSSTGNISNSTLNSHHRLLVYLCLGVSEIIMLIIAFTLLTIGSLKASYFMHHLTINSILSAPLSFFDSTPIGRIINRLSRDLDVVDKLQDNLRMLTQSVYNVLMIIVLISISTPLFIPAIVPFIIVYSIIMRYFIPTSRQLKRIESVNRSPILSTIGETIKGTSSIKAFGKEEQVIEKLSKQINKFAQCRYLSNMANRWLATRLELLGNLTVFFASMSATISTKYFDLSPGMAGLSVSFALTITEVLNILVRMISEMESNIVSIERLKEYQNIQSENEYLDNQGTNVLWTPTNGSIEFRDFSMKYRPELNFVLKDINLKINGGERIGIIGRTGSGKSSITMALYNLYPKSNGELLIDGCDTSQIDIRQLRKQLIIIPQDIVLFSGTLRFNLDPFNEHSDESIWRAISQCNLNKFISKSNISLDHVITENGKNMSHGERQLICLCRTVLHKNHAKIVVMDEFTSSVDSETDSNVQNAISDIYLNKGATILVISHRLTSITEYDRIIVLDNGKVAEFDSPSNLLKTPTSLYYQLHCEHSNQMAM